MGNKLLNKKNNFKNSKIKERYIFKYKDIEINILVKNIKSVYLKIKEDLNIYLSIPNALNKEKEILKILDSKYHWIKKSLESMEKRSEEKKRNFTFKISKNFLENENYFKENFEKGIDILGINYSFVIIGKNEVLNISNNIINSNEITFKSKKDKENNIIYLNTNFDKNEVYTDLKNKLRELMRKESLKLINKWKIILNCDIERLSITSAKGSWGSCNTKKKYINLNIDLIHKEHKLIEYVVLHELCHLFYANHGKEFKNMMTKYMPDWKERKKELNL